MTSSTSPSSNSARSFDLGAILIRPLRQFAPWLVMVLLATWAGYPGVVCVTPMAWLLALRVGIDCVTNSASPEKSRRVQEAALGGGWFGMLQGGLFFVLIPRLGPLQEGEQISAILLSLVMLGMGIVVGAGLSALSAAMFERRRPAQGSNQGT